MQQAIKEFTFILFLVLMIGFTTFVFFKAPETKNKTFEEIASLFQPGGVIEVEEVVDDVFDESKAEGGPDGDKPIKERNGSVTSDKDYRKSEGGGGDVIIDVNEDGKKSEDKRSLTRSMEGGINNVQHNPNV